VELKVEDHLPLHGSLELNNRSTHDTTDLRLNALIRYDNLWQREHSVSLQYQTSPQDTSEVKTVAGSYVLPAPWSESHVLVGYAIWSDSNTSTGVGFQEIGKGFILGGRYIIPLPPKDRYTHNVTLGVDYKDFKETNLSFAGAGPKDQAPITYVPFSVAYSSALPDETGFTRFSAGLNFVFRGLVATEQNFATKRYGSTGNYAYVTAGVERSQKLPGGAGLSLKVDGQAADQPLIANEEYSAGGMFSVRGYKESEALGDNALHGSAELSAPDLGELVKAGPNFSLVPFVFYDAAYLKVKDALPGQEKSIKLAGTGVGVRGSLFRHLEYETAWAVALQDTDRTARGDWMVHFLVKAAF